MADRERDIYAEWAILPDAKFHLLTRVMIIVPWSGAVPVDVLAAVPFVATRSLSLLATHKRAARKTEVSMRFAKGEGAGPKGRMKGRRKTLRLNLVEVVELRPPADVEPVHWRLLTTHDVTDATFAWQIVDWYRQRWIIEQLFRLMKTHGLHIEDSQLANAKALIKLAAIAPRLQP